MIVTGQITQTATRSFTECRRLVRMWIATVCVFGVLTGMGHGQGTFWQGRETWTDDGTRGWKGDTGDAEVCNPGTHLSLNHRLQPNVPRYGEDTARVHLPTGVVPSRVSFRFLARDVAPSQLRLCFESRTSSNLWYRLLPRPLQGQPKDYHVALAFTNGWIMGANSQHTQFMADVADIAWMGIYVRRHGMTAAQDYQIDDFTVTGKACSSDADGDGIEDAWENAHGLNAANCSDRDVDRDRDGMSSYAEFRAGTDPGNGDSVLAVTIDTVRQSGDTAPSVVLRWGSISNRTYSVLRGSGIRGGLAPLEKGIPATPPENAYTLSAEHVNAAFYRIEVETE